MVEGKYTPRASIAGAGRGSGTVHVGAGAHGTLTQMGRDVGSAAGAGGRTGGRVLGLIEGKVSHFQTVGHD